MVENVIQKLTKEEFQQLLEHVGKMTNNGRMCKFIFKRKGEINKDEIFKFIFSTKRTKENDYLIRNEWSQLKKKIETFIVLTFESDMPKYYSFYNSYTIGHWCIKRSLFYESEKYLDQAYDLAATAESWEGLLKINKYRFYIQQFSKSKAEEKLEKMQTFINEQEVYLKKLVNQEYSVIRYLKSAALKTAQSLRMSVEYNHTDAPFTIDSKIHSSNLSLYFYHKSNAFRLSGKQAIHELEKAIHFLKTTNEFFAKDDELNSVNATLAMEYALIGEYKESITIYKEIISSDYFKNVSSKNAILFNYITTLIKGKEYKIALENITNLELLEPEPVVLERIGFHKLNCYIYLRDLANIKKNLPKDIQASDISIRVYYRLLYTIYYLIKGDIEMAEREINNILVIKNLEFTDYKIVLKFFQKYIEILHQKTNSKIYSSSIKNFGKDIMDYHFENTNQNIMPFVWLQETVSSELKSLN